MYPNNRNLLTSWYRVSIGEEIENSDIFFRFMACWVSLNGLYNSFCFENYSGGDKNKLKYFATHDQDAIQKHSELLQNNTDYKGAVTKLKERGGVTDLRTGQITVITDQTKFEDVILCVYTARNNFFHADKDIGEPEDVEVITASHAIVSSFLGAYFDQ
jgi:hypothetical protein